MKVLVAILTFLMAFLATAQNITLNPNSKPAGSPAFELIVTGSGFSPTEVVFFDSWILVPYSQTSTQLRVSVPTERIATVGTKTVYVGGPEYQSDFVQFTVTPPLPVLTSVNPNFVNALEPTYIMLATGSGFVSTSVIRWNGNPLATTFVDSTRLTATVPAANIAAAGSASITVNTPGGGTSAAQTVTIGAPRPVVNGLNPNVGYIGGPNVQATVTGQYFVPGTYVSAGGSSVTTTYVNSTTLNVVLVPFATAGSYHIRAHNPDGTTSYVGAAFYVENAVPVLTNVHPSTVESRLGGGIVTVIGTGFVSGSKVWINGEQVSTQYVNSTTLEGSAPGSTYLYSGLVPVQVKSPSPGGGDSNILNISVVNPVPVVNSISPNRVDVGSNSFDITLNGFNFRPETKVKWDGTDLFTYGPPSSWDSIQAFVPSSMLATPGIKAITAFTYGAGGGTSSTHYFTVGNLLTQNVALSDHTQPNQQIVVLVNAIGGGRLRTFQPTLVNGEYRIAHDLPFGSYELEIFDARFLRKKIIVALTGNEITAPAVTLVNGDCDSNNVIDLSDYTIVAVAFNALPSSPNWDVRADLNGDGVVDLTDYTIVAVGFNKIGD